MLQNKYKLYSLIVMLLLVTNNLLGQSGLDNALPSETYYKENIAVNNINSNKPTLDWIDDDDDLFPPGQGESSSGGGNWVGSPISDGVIPILSISILFILYTILMWWINVYRKGKE